MDSTPHSFAEIMHSYCLPGKGLSVIGHCIEVMGVENSDDRNEGCDALDNTR